MRRYLVFLVLLAACGNTSTSSPTSKVSSGTSGAEDGVLGDALLGAEDTGVPDGQAVADAGAPGDAGIDASVPVCQPGATECKDAATARSCLSNGSGWAELSCSPGPCVGGGCCHAGPQVCNGNLIVQGFCGTLQVVVADCAATQQICKQAKCVAPTCQSGSQQCAGNQLQSCQADGSGWSTTTCDDGNVCTMDACDPVTGCAQVDKLFGVTYGGWNSDAANALIALADGGFALGSSTQSLDLPGGQKSAGNGDAWLVRTDAGGKLLWNQSYGGTYIDAAFALTVLADGGFALAGTTASSDLPGGQKKAGGFDAWLVRTDAGGKLLWNRTFGGSNDDAAYAVVALADGGLAMAGYQTEPAANPGVFDAADGWLGRTDADGNLLWSQTFGGAKGDQAQDLAVLANGGYVLAGHTRSSDLPGGQKSAGGLDFWLVRADASGQLLWNQTYGGKGDDLAREVTMLTDGGFAVAGSTNSSDLPGGAASVGDYDFWLVRTDSAGQLLWSQTYGGSGHDWASGLTALADGGVAVTGVTTSANLPGGQNSAGNGDAWLVRTDAAGKLLWNRTYGGSDLDWAAAVTTVAGGGLALAGSALSVDLPGGATTAGGGDLWLLRTDPWGHASCAEAGVCAGKGFADCDDANPCTTDSCDPISGCTHKPVLDGLACGGKVCKRACQQGECVATAPTCGGYSSCIEPLGCQCNVGFSGGDGKNCKQVACSDQQVAIDVDGKAFCAPDYPAWGIRPESPPAAWFTDNGDGTVSDSQSKIVWQKTEFGKAMPLAVAKAKCQALVLGGHSDWRLPTLFELATLVDFAKQQPAMPAIPFGITAPARYWSADLRNLSLGGSWSVNFTDGSIDATTGNARARCIRSAALLAPVSRYQVNAAAGTVEDTVTKLTWQRDGNASGNKTWVDAKTYCKGLALSGGGWRLPTIVELSSILDLKAGSAAIDPVAFPDTPSWTAAWSSTQGIPSGSVWRVHFEWGDVSYVGSANATTGTARVRCVR